MTYRRFDLLIAEARGRPQIWRIIASLITVFAFAGAWVVFLYWLITHGFLADRYADLADFDYAPEGALLMLAMIAGGLGLGTWFAAWIWHNRSLRSLIGKGPRTLRDFAKATCATWIIAALALALFLPLSPVIDQNLPFREWLFWLPIAVPFILLQTGAEELLFRGYLQSQLAARFKSVWIWLVFPSLLFGLGHFVPGDTIMPGLIYVGLTFVFGLIAADLTARTGSLGAAWGLHFANNCVAILVVVYLGAGSGLGLYSAGSLDDYLQLSPWLLIDMFLLGLVWWLIRKWVED